ncbi:MAG: hypothetical protein ACYC61_14695, partial [Isosphaeraceae bacterium]
RREAAIVAAFLAGVVAIGFLSSKGPVVAPRKSDRPKGNELSLDGTEQVASGRIRIVHDERLGMPVFRSSGYVYISREELSAGNLDQDRVDVLIENYQDALEEFRSDERSTADDIARGIGISDASNLEAEREAIAELNYQIEILKEYRAKLRR